MTLVEHRADPSGRREPRRSSRCATSSSATARRAPPAVDDVSFTIARGETLGLVGESGSGKTTIGRAILGLQPVTSGQILFEGRDITRASAAERRALQGDLRAVFQDPFSSLNPRRPIGDAHHRADAGGRRPARRARPARAERCSTPSGSPPGSRSALPAPVLGRPAPAHRDRARAGHRSAARRLRRGGERARPLDPGAGAEPARRPAGGRGPRLPLHRARHGGRGVPRPARRRAQPRTDGGGGADARGDAQPAGPLHARAHGGLARSRSRRAGATPRGVADAEGVRAGGAELVRRRPAASVSGTSRRRAATAPARSRGTTSTIGLGESFRLHSTIVAGSMSRDGHERELVPPILPARRLARDVHAGAGGDEFEAARPRCRRSVRASGASRLVADRRSTSRRPRARRRRPRRRPHRSSRGSRPTPGRPAGGPRGTTSTRGSSQSGSMRMRGGRRIGAGREDHIDPAALEVGGDIEEPEPAHLDARLRESPASSRRSPRSSSAPAPAATTPTRSTGRALVALASIAPS